MFAQRSVESRDATRRPATTVAPFAWATLDNSTRKGQYRLNKWKRSIQSDILRKNPSGMLKGDSSCPLE
jgi:hypothetical protein